jgi:serine/threonine protein kinase
MNSKYKINYLIFRDLAARNWLLNENEFLKLADFGSVEELRENNVFKIGQDRELPIKWTAYEVFDSSNF